MSSEPQTGLYCGVVKQASSHGVRVVPIPGIATVEVGTGFDVEDITLLLVGSTSSKTKKSSSSICGRLKR